MVSQVRIFNFLIKVMLFLVFNKKFSATYTQTSQLLPLLDKEAEFSGQNHVEIITSTYWNIKVQY